MLNNKSERERAREPRVSLELGETAATIATVAMTRQKKWTPDFWSEKSLSSFKIEVPAMYVS